MTNEEEIKGLREAVVKIELGIQSSKGPVKGDDRGFSEENWTTKTVRKMFDSSVGKLRERTVN